MAALDAGIRGPDAARPADHAFFRRTPGFTGYLFHDAAGAPAGYAQLADWGSIAPLLAATPELQRPILAYVLAQAAGRGLRGGP